MFGNYSFEYSATKSLHAEWQNPDDSFMILFFLVSKLHR